MIEKPSSDPYKLISWWPSYDEDELFSLSSNHSADAQVSKDALEAHVTGVNTYEADSSGEMFKVHVNGYRSIQTRWAENVTCQETVASLINDTIPMPITSIRRRTLLATLQQHKSYAHKRKINAISRSE